MSKLAELLKQQAEIARLVAIEMENERRAAEEKKEKPIVKPKKKIPKTRTNLAISRLHKRLARKITNVKIGDVVVKNKRLSEKNKNILALRKLIIKKDLAAIFRLKFNTNVKITAQQFNTIWAIASLKRYAAKLIVSGREQIIFMNENNREVFRQLLTNGYLEHTDDNVGSDPYEAVEIENVKFRRLLQFGRPWKQKNGGFFPYENRSVIKLERYQIYGNYQSNDENCLIHTLKLYGIDVAVLKNIQLRYLGASCIAKRDLHNISDTIERNIKLVFYDKNEKLQTQMYGTGKYDIIEIALYMNHYFINEQTSYTRHSIKNYNEYCGLENFGDIIKKVNNKIIRNANSPKCNSIYLIKTLFEQGMFTAANMSKVPEIKFDSKYREMYDLKYIESEQKRTIPLLRKKKEKKSEEGDYGEDGDYGEYDDYKEYNEQIRNSEVNVENKEEKKELTDDEKNYEYHPGEEYWRGSNRISLSEYGSLPLFVADIESFVCNKNHKLFMIGVMGGLKTVEKIFMPEPQIFSVYQNKSKLTLEERRQKIVNKFLNSMLKMEKVPTLKKNKEGDIVPDKENPLPILCYFHNLKYDYNVLEKYLNVTSICEKNNSLYEVQIIYKKRVIIFRDSYKMIPLALKDFCKELMLPDEINKKEAIAYKFYDPKRMDKFIDCPIAEYEVLLPNDEKEIFRQNIVKFGNYDEENKTFDPIIYYMEYLRYDCIVLWEGLRQFNELIEEITGSMCIYDCLTISSLTDQYMKISGAYDGFFGVTGNLREYINKAVFGGRVCVNPKYLKREIEGKITDYDGVSLYPSAMSYLCSDIGLPYGRAKRLPKDDQEFWKTTTYAVLTVQINKVNKTQQMPFITYKHNSKVEYINYPPPEPIVIDKITLEDWINFHEIEYEVLDGVYWDKGGNTKIAEVINELFEMRMQYKKTQPALANAVKLMMNSAYGKTILKKSFTSRTIKHTDNDESMKQLEYNANKILRKLVDDHNASFKEARKKATDKWIQKRYPKLNIGENMTSEDIRFYKLKCTEWKSKCGVEWTDKWKQSDSYLKYLKDFDEIKIDAQNKIANKDYEAGVEIVKNDYVINNFNTIISVRFLNPKTFEVVQASSDDSYNRAHAGCMILSYSKRIMNEVFNTANDHQIPIFYTDTDSMHLFYRDVWALEKLYKGRYDRELNGKKLRQFHIDFGIPFTDENGVKRKLEDGVYASNSIFLGKKSYIDVLVGEYKTKNGEKKIINGLHYRMKGITKEGLTQAGKDNNGLLNMYRRLMKPGEEINIVLNPFDKDNNKQKVLFDFGKRGTVRTKGEFIRKVKF